MIFGGRRAKTAPLVYQALNWEHGVFVGSIMASETTAAAAGAVGVVRRDPMAMLPFCGYNMADYWAHWIEMGKKLGGNAPKIFNVNWFRTDDNGSFIWPGYGDNMRVLDWIIERAENAADAVETPIGYEPKPEDINIEGLENDGITTEVVKNLLNVDKSLWKEDVKGIKEFYGKFGDKLPAELKKELELLEERLS
jgi:phosphoenolpyruvate carboxykinase (GTP)